MHLWTQYELEYNRKYSDPVGKKHSRGKNNIILSNSKFLSTDKFKTNLNNNILLIGDNRSGFDTCFIKPNILQANQNYIIIDHRDNYLNFSEKYLLDAGYTIQKYNLESYDSLSFNPFDKIKSNQDIIDFSNCIIKNTENATTEYLLLEQELLNALIFCAITINEKSVEAMVDIFNNKEYFKRFILEKENNLYHNVRLLNNDIFDYVYMCTKLRVDSLYKKELNNKKIDFEKLKIEKQAIFINITLQSNSYGYLIDTLVMQLSKYLQNEKLIRNTLFMLDNFINIEFMNYLSKVNKNKVSYVLICNGMADFKFDNKYQTIIDYFNIILYLGNNQQSTAEFLKALFDMDEENKLADDEIPMLEEDSCLLFIKGDRYFDKKFILQKHKNFKKIK